MFKEGHDAKKVLKFIPLIQILHNIFLINISYLLRFQENRLCKHWTKFVFFSFHVRILLKLSCTHNIRSIKTQTKYSKTALICNFKFNCLRKVNSEHFCCYFLEFFFFTKLRDILIVSIFK